MSVFARMDDYDSELFQVQKVPEAAAKRSKAEGTTVESKDSAQLTPSNKSQPVAQGPRTDPELTKVLTNKSLNSPFRPQLSSLASSDTSSPSPTTKKTPEAAKANRTLNYSLRGLAPPVRAIASTEVNITNAQAQTVVRSVGAFTTHCGNDRYQHPISLYYQRHC